MGFMDKAKKLAEQAQQKLDEAQTQFNQNPSQPQGGGVQYDQHGRPVQQAPPAGEASPPPAPPSAPTPDPAAPDAPAAASPPIPEPSAPPAAAAEEEQPPPPRSGDANASPDPFKPLQ